ncbi:hypothetical protein X798_02626 [Onchocerca flexuosa]|uniref:CPSF_A domain-containing protein n=2 Tax=Onchocerca flexuosa TaxID=387005 RepID=A0A183HCG4_9BILA|nr:hypothetical protein X798_02626 [Onchocerca flexuosa]VDO42275.1 unnamed protein product [Onchocerca flexuosa]
MIAGSGELCKFTANRFVHLDDNDLVCTVQSPSFTSEHSVRIRLCAYVCMNPFMCTMACDVSACVRDAVLCAKVGEHLASVFQ